LCGVPVTGRAGTPASLASLGASLAIFMVVGAAMWSQLTVGLVPGGLAAFSWAATLSVTTYWLHPGALAAFPAAELAWMAASPLALGGAIWSAARLVRRVPLPPRALALQTRLAVAACCGMLAFFAGCGLRVTSGGQGLFHAGTIDIIGVGVLAAVLAVASQAARHARLLLEARAEGTPR
jgi:hypothetical protein